MLLFHEISKDAYGAIGAIIAALVSLIAAILAIIQKRAADKSIEQFKSGLEKSKIDYQAITNERLSQNNARLEYEYEARKRLYKEWEPLIFQFSDYASNAYYQVQGLARTSRLSALNKKNYLGEFGYYFKSTVYKLFAPLAIYRLMQKKLTLVDMKLDVKIKLQYEIIKRIYLSWTDDYKIAKMAGLEYDPNVSDWETCRKQNPAKYWRQGLPTGLLDIVIDLLLKKEADGTQRLITYGEFELNSNKDEYTQKQLDLIKDILTGFTPLQRPVLWALLIIQSFLYKSILTTQDLDSADPKINKEKQKLFVIPEKDRPEFYFASDTTESEKKLKGFYSTYNSYLNDNIFIDDQL